MRSLSRLVLAITGMPLLLACAAPEASGPGPATGAEGPLVLRGQVVYLQRSALPPDAQLVVELRDLSAGEGAVVAESRTGTAGRQVPIPFELQVDRARLAAGHSYALRAALSERGQPRWVSEPLAVDPLRGDQDVGELRLAPFEARPFAAEFHCGDTRVLISPEGSALRMTVGDQDFRMQQAASASGARYVGMDRPGVQFWNKGRMATLEIDGRRYPECVQAEVATGHATAWRASGNEPGWRLDLDASTLRFTTQAGAALTTEHPAAETSPAGVSPAWRRYTTVLDGQPFVATVHPVVCMDSMSGMPHPERVTVVHGAREYSGCGGDPATLLRGGEWVVEDLNGGGIIDNSRATLVFGTDGRVSGRASCNTYGGPYSLSGEGLRVGPVAATMKACNPALDAQERRFLEALDATQRFEIDATGALHLLGPAGRSIKARR